MTHTHRGVEVVVTGERDTKTALEMMSGAGRSYLAKGLLISCLAHAVLIGLTSFGLYADWMRFGVKMPQELKLLKKQIALDEMDARRQAEREKAAASAKEHVKGPSSEKPSARSPVPEVVREASAVSTDRPTASSLNLDEELGLE